MQEIYTSSNVKYRGSILLVYDTWDLTQNKRESIIPYIIFCYILL